MSFGEAISTCFNKFVDFKGRASRSEFWYFYLFYAIVTFGAGAVSEDFGNAALAILLLPILAASARRLHDSDRSGWFMLIPIANIVFFATEGTNGPNRFGEKPAK
jgi:uncharacterized membrane protein YhaH (DUF805 family)